jgi:hypothetical protein
LPPEPVTVPAFVKDKHFKISAAVKAQNIAFDPMYPSNNSISFNPLASIAYSVNNHFACFLSYTPILNNRNEGAYHHYDTVNLGRVAYHGSRLDIGVGYYSRFGISRYEVFAGYGNGIVKKEQQLSFLSDTQFHSFYSLGMYNYAGRYNTYFVQSAAGIGNKYFSFMLGIKFAWLKFYSLAYSSDGIKNYIVTGYYEPSVSSKVFLLCTPHFDVQAGFKNIKLNAQLGMLEEMRQLRYDGHGLVYFSLGICAFV